jgi:hypothetical protein
VDYGIPIQHNLHFIARVGDNESDVVRQHDCLPVDHWENKENIYEMTLYCMSEWSSKWNIEKNDVDQRFSFAQLYALNVTSEQLYFWSTYWFFNCALPTFGPMCQYSFDEDKPSQLTLNKIISDFYRRNQTSQMNQSCYIHLECNLGLSSLCISWTDICDGIIRCINGTDEEHCWQLEIHECNEDRFRCINGQCIPSSFLNDNIDAPDCLDGSDEHSYSLLDISWNSVGLVFKLEEISCLKWSGIGSPYDTGRIYGCSGLHFKGSNEQTFFAHKPNTMSNICWSALNCHLKLLELLDYFNCTDVCQNETCKQIITNDCPDMFFIPNVPIAFGHIYFAYTKEYIINQTTWSNTPEYVCYNEQLCNGFYPNKTLISFNNTTCRRPQDFQLDFIHDYPGVTSLRYCLRSIRI